MFMTPPSIDTTSGYATGQMLDSNTLGVFFEYKGCMLAFGHPDLRLVGPPAQPRVISVMHHGAHGDGTSDDRTAIQAALDAASNCTGGCTVLFPAGFTFLCTGALLVRPAQSAQHLQLEGTIAMDVANWDPQSTALLVVDGVDGLRVSGSGSEQGRIPKPSR